MKSKQTKKLRVFLGGTCNESNWREWFILYVDKTVCSWFDPVVDDWTEDCMQQEIEERQLCDFCLYTITPKMTGVYSIAEVVDDSNKKPDRTVLVLLRDDEGRRFSEGQWRSLISVARMVKANGGKVFDNLKSAAVYFSGK